MHPFIMADSPLQKAASIHVMNNECIYLRIYRSAHNEKKPTFLMGTDLAKLIHLLGYLHELVDIAC